MDVTALLHRFKGAGQLCEPLPPICAASDDLSGIVKSILRDLDPTAATVHNHIDQRAAFDAIIFGLRTGCQWNHAPAGAPSRLTHK
jgi:transposase